MKNFLNILGYSKQLQEKNKIAYVIAAIALVQLLLFMAFYVFMVGSVPLIIETTVIIVVYFIVFVLLKKRFFVIAKTLITLGLNIQVALLVYIWFPHETYLFLFFFLVPPITFFIMDIGNTTEKKLLILLNSFSAMTLLLTVILKPLELIELDEEYVIILKVMSIFSTIFIEALVFYFYAMSLAKTHSELKLLANTDALTNISNRRVLFEQGEMLACIHSKYEKTFTLMILDIDHFKIINDKYGHPAGDAVLKEISYVISQNIRKEDLVCRYGGEEFAILFKNMNHDNHKTIENIRQVMNDHLFNVGDGLFTSITFSAGVVTYSDEIGGFDELVKRADSLLYEAKTLGRNLVRYDENVDLSSK